MVGSRANYVNPQNVTLTNTTDSLEYTQLYNVEPDITRNVTKHQLTDDTIYNMPSLFMNSIQGNIVLTTPEVAALVTLAESFEIKLWTVSFTSDSGNNVTITFPAQLQTFRPLGSEFEDATFYFRLECTEVVSVA